MLLHWSACVAALVGAVVWAVRQGRALLRVGAEPVDDTLLPAPRYRSAADERWTWRDDAEVELLARAADR